MACFCTGACLRGEGCAAYPINRTVVDDCTFADNTTMPILACPYCACHHGGVCSLVKAIEYHENGSISRIEFHDIYGAECE